MVEGKAGVRIVQVCVLGWSGVVGGMCVGLGWVVYSVGVGLGSGRREGGVRMVGAAGLVGVCLLGWVGLYQGWCQVGQR